MLGSYALLQLCEFKPKRMSVWDRVLKACYHKQRQDGFMYQITDVNTEASPLSEFVFLEENRTLTPLVVK